MKLTMKDLFTINRRDLFMAFVAIMAFIAAIPLVTYLYFAQDLQSKDSIMNRNNTGVVLTDRNDKPFFSFYEVKNKIFVPLAEIPEHTQRAVIASEDQEFYEHPGFSLRGILRSIILNFKEGDIAYGGSTITQQLVKNSLLTPRRDFVRKSQELVLAHEIDRRFDKNEILEMYLNSAYFGEGAFGIEEAAQTYFSKNAKDLTLAESALLTAILPSPSLLSPLSGDREALKQRQEIVLNQMVEEGYIAPEQKEEALKEEIVFEPKEDGLNTLAPHFALMVKNELEEKYGEEEIIRSGFKVKTTLDLSWQEYAEKVVQDQVKRLARNRVTNGAAVVLDPKTGEIKTLVGSYNWAEGSFGKVNVVTAPRQPGSSFKPIVYVAGFEKRAITPGTVLKDEPVTYNIPGSPPYKPKNYDNRFRGRVLPRQALANSLNVPAVEVMSKVGVDDAIDMAHRLGIDDLKDKDRHGLSLVLGAGEVKLLDLTQAYAVFANNGLKNEPTTILEIKDKYNKTIYKYEPEAERVLDPEYAFLISSYLSDASARRDVFGNALDISRVAAVKTGTTENYKDSLTIGYTPSLTVGVWVGNNDGATMDNIAGSLGAAPIWKSLMERFLAGTPVEKFEPPSGLVAKSVCRGSGLLLREATSSGYMEYFFPGTEPTGFCNLPKASPSPAGTTEQKPEDKKEEKEEKREEKEDRRGGPQVEVIQEGETEVLIEIREERND